MLGTHTLVRLSELPDVPLSELKIIEPPVKRRTWSNSRLIVLPDNTTIPVLWHLAFRRFGPWNPAQQRPYWLDKNFRNESPDNVGLTDHGTLPSAAPKLNINAPAGTRAYQKAYRALRRDRIREHQAAYRKRLRDANASNDTLRDQLTAAEEKLARLLNSLTPPPDEGPSRG